MAELQHTEWSERQIALATLDGDLGKLFEQVKPHLNHVEAGDTQRRYVRELADVFTQLGAEGHSIASDVDRTYHDLNRAAEAAGGDSAEAASYSRA